MSEIHGCHNIGFESIDRDHSQQLENDVKEPAMNGRCIVKYAIVAILAITLFGQPSGVDAQVTLTAFNLEQLRLFSDSFSNSSVTLSLTSGDPHPVTGVVTPGHYWVNGDHIANPTQSEPTFLELSGNGNTYNLSGATINLDTRKLDGFGRALGHDSGIEVVKVSGTDNTVNGLNLIGHDLALDTDPNAQRHADWAGVYVQLTGTDNTMQGVNVLSRGSSPYGLGDAFGKGARSFPQGEPADEGGHPWVGHNKTSAFQVHDAQGAVIDDMHLDVRTYGHGFFVQVSDDTTLTNSTVTGELFPSSNVSNHPKYIEYGGITKDGNPIPDDIFISGAEDGVRMYTGASNLTVDNVVVTNMRSGFATALASGTVSLSNVESYGAEHGFDFRRNTTITNAKGDMVNGPLLWVPYSNTANSSVDVELVGGTPHHDWGAAFFSGDEVDVNITSSIPAGTLGEHAVIRIGQRWWNDWRDHDDLDSFEEDAWDYVDSKFTNDTNQMLAIGEDVQGNVGSSKGYVLSNGKNNYYDGKTLVLAGTRLELAQANGLGNSGTETGAAFSGSNIVYTGTATALTLDDNASIVQSGATLELQAGLSIVDEKLTISGDGVDGKGALFSDGQTGTGTRFGDSSNGNESTIFLDGDASIGVGITGNQLLVGRVQGTGNLTKRGSGILAMEKSSTFTGDLIVAEGSVVARTGVVKHGLTVNAGASIRGKGNMLGTSDGVVQLDGTLDLNDRTDASNLSGIIGLLNGDGQVTMSNPESGARATLQIAGDGADGNFTGEIENDVTLVKSGDNKQTLGGFLSHTGTTTVSGGGLYIDGTHLGGGQYTVNDGGTLGGLGSIQANATLESGAALEPGDADGTSQGMLTIGGSYSQAAGAVLGIDIEDTSSHDRLTTWGTTSLAGILDLNSIDPAQYSIGDTLTLLNSFSSVTGQFDFINGVSVGNVDGFGAGLAVQYNAQNVTAQVSIIGDADLDGQVDVLNDAFRLVGNLGISSRATWADGDFNGDGAVDVLGDAFALVGNLGANANGSAAANTSAVPEPNAVFLLAALAMPSLSTRRKS